jgi:hypothetical protein
MTTKRDSGAARHCAVATAAAVSAIGPTLAFAARFEPPAGGKSLSRRGLRAPAPAWPDGHPLGANR